MANPADDLYEIFKIWQRTKSPNQQQPSVKVARFLENSNAEKQSDGWERQRHASRCLEAIAVVIREMEESGEDVVNEKIYFKEWAKAVYSYPEGWTTHSSGVSDIALGTLGMFRNTARRFVPELKDGALEELRALLENEPSLTVPVGSYPYELYDYFNRVKFHLKKCIDDYSVTNSFDLYRAAEDYRAAVFMMSNGNFVTNPADWKRHAAKTFVVTLAKNVTGKVMDETSEQLAQRVVKALGNVGQKALEAGAGG